MSLHYIEAIGNSFISKKQQILSVDQNANCIPWIYAHSVQANLPLLPKIKNIVAVASGKGGVGKSTIAFNLATTLSAAGLSVGLLDADIYGPSLPILTGISEKVQASEDKKLIPHQYAGLSLISIGHLVSPETALAWRGPMAGGALMQLFTQTAWPSLDLLIVDLPPGTGDLLLTLCQKIPLTGVITVTVNHPLVKADVDRSYQMFQKLGVNHLGTVLNMFHDFQENLINNHKDILAKFPYSVEILQGTSQAEPFGVMYPESLITKEFESLSENLIDRLSLQPLASKIPASLLKGNVIIS